MSKKRKNIEQNKNEESNFAFLPKEKRKNTGTNIIQHTSPKILFEDKNNIANQNLFGFTLCDDNYTQEEVNLTTAANLNSKEFIGVRSGFPKTDNILQEEKNMLIEHIKTKKKEEKYIASLLNKKKKIVKTSNDDYDILSFSNSINKRKNDSIDELNETNSHEINNTQSDSNVSNNNISDDDFSNSSEQFIDDETLKNTKLFIINNCEICKISLIDELGRDESATIKLVRILNSSSTSGGNTQLINLIHHSRRECVENPAIKNSIHINFWSKAMLYFHVNGYCDSINPNRVNNSNIRKIQDIISYMYENEIICEDPTGQKLIDQSSLNKFYKCISLQHKCLLLKNQLQKEKLRLSNHNEHNNAKKKNN